DGDRAGRAGRGQLHDVHVVVDPGVVVDGEADPLAVEALAPLHVAEGNDHPPQRPLHATLLVRAAASSYGPAGTGPELMGRGRSARLAWSHAGHLPEIGEG